MKRTLFERVRHVGHLRAPVSLLDEDPGRAIHQVLDPTGRDATCHMADIQTD